MAICKNCGANIDESAKFCTSCGQPNTPSMPAMDTTVSGGYTEPTYTEPTANQGASNYGQTSYNGGFQQTGYGQSSYNGGYQQPQQNTYGQNTYGQPNYNQGAYGQPMYNAQPVAPQTEKTNAMALTGFIISICSAVLCCCGLLAIPGLIFSIIGMSQTKDGKKGKGFALAGVIISAIVLVIWIVSLILQGTGVIEPVDFNEVFENM